MQNKILAVILVVVGSTIALEFAPILGGRSGQGRTTRYWDCCKPSCAWIENVKTETPVASCAKDGHTTLNMHNKSGCDDNGISYMCNDQTPIIIDDNLAYGFAAASFSGGIDTKDCCVCYKLTFTNQLVGKTYIVQVTNTGGDLGANQFDLAMPGSGVGIFTRGCMTQWGTGPNGWGDQYGGVRSASDCSQLPVPLQAGCKFRFTWFRNADNPTINFEAVTCPNELIARSNCQ